MTAIEADVPDGALEPYTDALRRGEVVGLPTDTVYGLAADAAQPAAIARLFVLKGRPDSVALPVLVASSEQAAPLVAPDARPVLELVARRFWPGALTLVLPRAADTELDLGGDPATIGLRSPANPLVRALCSAVGPLAVTSANRHGDSPCTTAAELRALFGDEVPALDGGRCAGEPSTVVSLVGPEPALLRSGPVPLGAVLAALAE